MTEYLSEADLYRAACAPRELPDTFVASMRWHLIRQGSANTLAVALRSALTLAEEWKGLAEASRELGQEEAREGQPSEWMAGLIAGQNHQATYCANMLLRHLAQELYRDCVPREERVL